MSSGESVDSVSRHSTSSGDSFQRKRARGSRKHNEQKSAHRRPLSGQRQAPLSSNGQQASGSLKRRDLVSKYTKSEKIASQQKGDAEEESRGHSSSERQRRRHVELSKSQSSDSKGQRREEKESEQLKETPLLEATLMTKRAPSVLSEGSDIPRDSISTSSGQPTRENHDSDKSSLRSKTVNRTRQLPSIISSNSKSIAFLQKSAVQVSLKQEKIHCSIRNEGFLMAVDLAYDILARHRPRFEFLLSLAEWRHVHVLMLYARVFNCELAAAKIDQPKDFNIYLPDDVRVLEPLGVVLGSIGIVEDKDNGVTYIPVAKPIRNKAYAPHDPNDVTTFMEWSQYKWNASWAQAELEREERKEAARSRGITIPTREFAPNHSKLRVWEKLALEIWLGWDEELWYSYVVATRALSRDYSLVNFPRDPTGSYAWLIPRLNAGSRVYGRLPSPSLANDVWMIALLFNLSDLPSARTGSWYYKTKVIENIVEILHLYLESARK
eukprot:scaffold5912_cov101-Cylindrotheca_fusiformis.AAC.2